MLSRVLLFCLAITAHAQYWTVTGNLTYARYFHTATLLPNGNVLVAAGAYFDNGFISLNSAELYNATTGVWTVTGYLTYARLSHTATLLPSGNVLVAAGFDINYNGMNTAELYNASTGVWTLTGNLTYARERHTATLLPNENVLAAGGTDSVYNYPNSAELYNAATGVWTVTGNLTYARYGHTATLLSNGNVLVAGGYNTINGYLKSPELYNASTGVWTVIGSLAYARYYHTATLLPNGNVLVAGGYYNPEVNEVIYLNSAELYNASTDVWTVTGNLTYARFVHTATLLPNGNVLVAAGSNDDALNSTELYSATTGVWTVTGSLTYARDDHTATLLPNGNVLVAGGEGLSGFLNSAEVYNGPNITTVTATTTSTATSTPNSSLNSPTSTPSSSPSSSSTPTSPSTSTSPNAASAPTNSPFPTKSNEITPTPSLDAVSASSSNLSAIVGGVVGGVVGFALLAIVMWLILLRYKRSPKNESDDGFDLNIHKLNNERSASKLSDVRSSTGSSSLISSRGMFSFSKDKPTYNYHVFISYRRVSDRNLANDLYLRLKQQKINGMNVQVFFDQDELKPAEEWEPGFLRALDSSLVFVPLLSRGSLALIENPKPGVKDHFLHEIEIALARFENKHSSIFPLFVADQSEDRNSYNKLKDLHIDKFPDIASQTLPTSTIRETMGKLLKIQGADCLPDNTRSTVSDIVNYLTTIPNVKVKKAN